MEVEIQEINITNLETTFKFPSKPIQTSLFKMIHNPAYNLVWICNVPEIDRFIFLVSLNPNIDKILIVFAMISATNEKVKYSFSISQVDNNNIKYNLHTYTSLIKGECISMGPFDARDFVSSHKFVCRIKFDEIYNCSENLLKSINYKQFDHISEDFGQLIDSKNHSDIILKTSDVELSAHRNILSARSPVFAAMFSHHTKENKDGVVKIDDIESDILHAMLGFIYTGKVEDVENKALDLYKVSDQYSLEGLKIICTEVLSRTMSINNVIDILVLADLYNNERLKKETFSFIKIYLKDVIDLPEFESLKKTNPGLVINVFIACVRS